MGRPASRRWRSTVRTPVGRCADGVRCAQGDPAIRQPALNPFQLLWFGAEVVHLDHHRGVRFHRHRRSPWSAYASHDVVQGPIGRRDRRAGRSDRFGPRRSRCRPAPSVRVVYPVKDYGYSSPSEYSLADLAAPACTDLDHPGASSDAQKRASNRHPLVQSSGGGEYLTAATGLVTCECRRKERNLR